MVRGALLASRPSAGLPPRPGAHLCPVMSVPVVVLNATHGRADRRPRGGRRFAWVVRTAPGLQSWCAPHGVRAPGAMNERREPLSLFFSAAAI
jgi:hypothetical protein